MQLIFKNKENTNGFTTWLKSFKEIQKSLLIECDLVNECFISKGFTADHTIVRYGKITFEDAGFIVDSIKDSTKTYDLSDWIKTNTERIKIGIFMILPKFIQVADTFAETNYTLTIEFDIFNGKEITEYHAQSINFKSKSLKMKVKDCNISEFEQLSDDLFFNKINVIPNAMSFEISTDTIKNLISISSVFVSDPNRDIITFYTKLDTTVNKWAIYAFDKTNESYDYLLGYLTDGDNLAENDIAIYRQSFLSAINKNNDDYIILTLSADNKQKIRITSANNYYTVLSTVRQ